jgi:glycyl-tRNA synthetase
MHRDFLMPKELKGDNMENELTMDKIVNLCKTRGFVYPGSEIYGGLANSWDYGPIGSELKKNIKELWWKRFVHENEYNVGIDAAIIMNPSVWKASGHLAGFSDPLIDCKECKTRHRADKLVEDYVNANNIKLDVGAMKNADLEKYIADNHIKCPNCGKSNFTSLRSFNLMFKTFMGVTEDSKSEVYLRPETAQGMFVDYKNVVRTQRPKMPFGIAQMGRSFRNEITPGNFIFRTREFEQMELEFFCKPGTDLEWFKFYKDEMRRWLKDLGIKSENLRERDHSPEELCFYSKATTDFEFKFPFGWGELWGIADRTDYDLTQHQKASGENMEYLDPITNEKYIPYVVEPALGVDRMFLTILCNAYEEQALDGGDTRTVLHLLPALAPYKVAVLPLSKKLSDKAREVRRLLARDFSVDFDESGSIGKRYRRQDEIGTPFCVTVDFDTLENDTVTIRDRDTMEQIRLPISELASYIVPKVKF